MRLRVGGMHAISLAGPHRNIVVSMIHKYLCWNKHLKFISSYSRQYYIMLDFIFLDQESDGGKNLSHRPKGDLGVCRVKPL